MNPNEKINSAADRDTPFSPVGREEYEIRTDESQTPGDENARLRFAEEALKKTQEQSKQLVEALRQSEENVYELQNELREKTRLAEERQAALESACRQATAILSACDDAERSRGFKLLNLFRRWKYQGFSRDRAERRAFRRWLRLRLFRGKTDSDRRFSPLQQILLPLQSEKEFLEEAVSGNFSALPDYADGENLPAVLPECSCLNEPYRLYDIIIFSVIDYDFRYQRPQQIADYFAGSGHRVFYINAGFSGNGSYSIQKKKNGLRVVALPNQAHAAVYSTVFADGGADFPALLDELVAREGIRDALLVLDYPNWISGASYLRNRYGFPMAADYMDDYLDFKDTANRKTELACQRMLTACDVVIASSAHLAEKAKQYSQNVHIVRNGTEFAHFHRAADRAKASSAKKVIGYYGAIAHWFDFKTIEVLSRRFPEERIVLIGAVTEGRKFLEALPNVELPGEKPYAELPDLLADFDVCLIPFDASTDLIKATNPVKFYEYLSAGKKVVATEIPELQPFAGKYVYLENDRERFADRVAECLNGTDTLASPEECMAFARENDWSERTRAFAGAAERCFPSVSIVLLCYNQLDYTKQCVKSILDKTAYPNYELVIVDNCSTDGTAEWLSEEAKRSDRIRPVFNTENRGFAGGNNDGIRASGGEYVVLLNNDTLVTRGWLTGLVKWARREGVGMAGPVTNSIGNEAMINVSYGKNVKKMDAAAYEYTARRMGREYAHKGILAMFCVIFRRDLTEKIGLLDEHYGVGMFEDDDYSAAVRREGLRLVLAEDVFIHHFGSVSFKKLKNETYRKLFEKNKAYYETKWQTEWKPPRYRPGVNPEE
ncbi:MAG: glycosyltransferase [Clostridia bacterium]|nr:glycosyltransferase [Clostridia bacterium]